MRKLLVLLAAAAVFTAVVTAATQGDVEFELLRGHIEEISAEQQVAIFWVCCIPPEVGRAARRLVALRNRQVGSDGQGTGFDFVFDAVINAARRDASPRRRRRSR